MMTDRGTFIVNGTERVVVSQLVRSPGVIFQPAAMPRPSSPAPSTLRGEWIELDVEASLQGCDAGPRGRKRRVSLFVLLRALGYGETPS